MIIVLAGDVFKAVTEYRIEQEEKERKRNEMERIQKEKEQEEKEQKEREKERKEKEREQKRKEKQLKEMQILRPDKSGLSSPKSGAVKLHGRVLPSLSPTPEKNHKTPGKLEVK